jgi:hypothetical protein
MAQGKAQSLSTVLFGSQPVTNISGVTLNFDQFVPKVGLLSASFAPALSNNRFRTGEDYLQLKGLPWKGQHWTFSAGDFRLPGQLLAVPFTNVFIPEIAGRVGWLEATHGGRTLWFFYGSGTISNTPRVVLRLSVPQRLGGFYFRQKLGNRLLLGARMMQFPNDLTALRKLSNLLTPGNLKSATTYMAKRPGRWRNEMARNSQPKMDRSPCWRVLLLAVRANYVFQIASYFPLLGSYLVTGQVFLEK